MLDYRGLFVTSLPLQQGDSYLSTVTIYDYDVADIMNDNNFSIVLVNFFILSSMQVVQVSNEKVPLLDHLVLAKKWNILPKKALNIIWCTTSHNVCTVLHPSLS